MVKYIAWGHVIGIKLYTNSLYEIVKEISLYILLNVLSNSSPKTSSSVWESVAYSVCLNFRIKRMSKSL